MARALSVVPEPARSAAGPIALADDVHAGLTRPLKHLAPRAAYDARGGLLFESLCAQPEYYVARAERAILRAAASALAATRPAELIELGCRPCGQSRALVEALARGGELRRYRPVDLCGEAVGASAAAALAVDPEIRVEGRVGDYEREPPHPEGPGLVTLLGGVLGNHSVLRRRALLARLRRALGTADRLLIGVELVHSPDAMRRAYDDGAGTAAALSRNGLAVVNRELGADFDPAAFDHVARYSTRRRRVEVSLQARAECTVHVPGAGLTLRFGAGEELVTKVSEKFTRASLDADLAAAGLVRRAWHTDRERRYALALAEPGTRGCA